MALSSLSTLQLKRLIHLVKEKEILQAKLTKVKQALDNFQNTTGDAGKLPAVARGVHRGRRRAKVKDSLLEMLEVAGKEGLTVKELAVRLKTTYNSVSTWFYTTGKKFKGITKVGRGRFAYMPK